MKNTVYRISVLVVVVMAIVGVIIFKSGKEKIDNSPDTISQDNKEPQIKKIPKLIELGRGICKYCKEMKPILDELAVEYKGKVVIKIIDIGDEPGEAEKYGIQLIPTQIFFDKDGKEVWRHEGFLPKEEIIKKFKEMGIN